MTDDDRKRLTEFFGEPWHALTAYGVYCATCAVTISDIHLHINRTFTTPDDMMALKERLVELGEEEWWDDFLDYAWKRWVREKDVRNEVKSWELWLLDPPRFCQLVADFLRERMVGG